MPEMDATDARLPLVLAEDPRASVMALSQQGLGPGSQHRAGSADPPGGAARSRRSTPGPPGGPFGYRLGAYVTVQVTQRSLADVSDGLAHIPEVLEVTGLPGVADLLVQVAAKDADDLWRITEQVSPSRGPSGSTPPWPCGGSSTTG